MPTREELDQADAALQRAGYSDDERLMVLDQLIGDDPNLPLPLRRGGSSEMEMLTGAAQAIVPAAGAAIGGSLGRMALGKIAPKTLPYLGPAASAVGEFTGAFAGGLPFQTPTEAATGAALSGITGLGVEGGLQMSGRAFGRAGKVTPRTMRETTAQGGFNRLRTMMGGVGEEEIVNEAEQLRRMATKARVEKSPGRVAAESKMRAFDESAAAKVPIEDVEARYNAGVYDPEIMRGGKLQTPQTIHEREIAAVDMAPIKQRILSLVDKDATSTGRIAVNNQLKGIAERLPERGTMADLDHFIREHTEPIKGQVQNLEASLPTGVQQKIVAGARRYRNTLLPEAKTDFAQAQNYMKATKNIRSMLVDKNGDLRKGAENIWRGIPRNKVVLRSLQEYDRVHGTKFAEKALDLARRANWTPGDAQDALGMIDASAGWWRRATALTARSVGKGLIGAAIPAGRAAAATTAFYSAMNPRNNP